MLLFHLFGRDGDGPHDLPVAPLTLLSDSGEKTDRFCMRADPVHLRPDQSRLLLFDAGVLDLEPDEVKALVGSINELVTQWGGHLEAPLPHRWYLFLPEAPGIQTTPLTQAMGRDVGPLLPTGPAGQEWHARLNEIQMLIHDHAVNCAREQDGRPTINSLWFWGGGSLPEQVDSTRWDCLWTDHPLLTGLAAQAAARQAGCPQDGDEWLARDCRQGGSHLILLDELERAVQYGDIEAWLEGVEQLERRWFAPLHKAVADTSLATLDIRAADGRKFRISKSALRRFWRRKRQLKEFAI